MFDNKKVNATMNLLYKKTKHHPLFLNVYKKGASMFLTEDTEVGIRVMFSYTYMQSFHAMLCAFLTTGIVEESNPYYIHIMTG